MKQIGLRQNTISNLMFFLFKILEYVFDRYRYIYSRYGVHGLFVSPIFLIQRVLKYMRQCRAIGTLIVPCWPSANYWSMLCPSGNGFIDQVIGYIDLPVAKMFYIPVKSQRYIFGITDLTF